MAKQLHNTHIVALYSKGDGRGKNSLKPSLCEALPKWNT